ncbi:MAG: hypothetical protein M1836_001152 [Candelina mexicana]|nr:MAG: hypothetical protein M1836_001152 [Candelina mexicana]
MPWNLRVAYTPAAAAVPQSIDQIQASFYCAIKNHLPVSVKAGGHSFGSYGLGGEDGRLAIDLEQMHAVTLHGNHTATIEPGARLGHVSVELYNQGRRAIPHGACPGVGLAGHALLVTWCKSHADGSMVYCSATENTDLFWALRGAGPSFGIVVEFEFDTFAPPDHVTPFTIDLPWSEEKAIDTLKAVQDFAMTAPKELNIFLFVSATSQIIQGLYFGDEHGLNQTLQPLLAEIKAEVSDMNEVGWLEGLDYFADGEALDQTYPYNSHASFYTTSLTIPALNDEQIKSLMSTMFANSHEDSAPHSWDIFFEMHGGNHSTVAQIDPSATAYVHRDKMLLLQLSDTGGSNGEFFDEGFAVLKRFMDSVTNTMAEGEWGMYANFLDTQLDGKTAQKRYYGHNLPRLSSIKAQLDAEDVFWNPQGISSSLSEIPIETL